MCPNGYEGELIKFEERLVVAEVGMEMLARLGDVDVSWDRGEKGKEKLER